MKTNPIIIERLFNAPAAKVWKAITDKNEMKNWYFDLKEFRAEKGFKFQFLGGHEGVQYVHLCEVTEVIPEKKISYSWRYEGYSGISQVTFELIEQENKTLLRLSHTGLETFPNENPDFALRNFEEGWNLFINKRLKKYLENNNYKNTISLNVSLQEVFNAVTQRIPEWWSSDFSGSTKNTGDEFTVRFGNTFKVMRIQNVVPDTRVEWVCINQHIEMPEGMEQLKNPTEWVGNSIIWELVATGSETKLSLTHIGLTPEVECWSVCEPGWNQTLNSLQSLLTKGSGKPFEKLDEEHLQRARKLQNN